MAVSAITETRQYLTFKLFDEIFAVDVGKVREILELTPITKIPRTPDYMRGLSICAAALCRLWICA